MIPSHLFDAPVYFVIGVLVAIVGIVFLVFPEGRKLKVAGGCVLAVGMLGALPFASVALMFFKAILIPDPPPEKRVLTQNETVDGIAFEAGTTVEVVRSEGRLIAAELTRPQTIDGLVVTGHISFWRGGGSEPTHFSSATLAAAQEIPGFAGMWCSPNQPMQINSSPPALDCELARAVIRDGIEIPAGAYIRIYGGTWKVELREAGEAALIAGLTIPAGWRIDLQVEPSFVISSFFLPKPTRPETQPWVEIDGFKVTGNIIFLEKGAFVMGDLWEDAVVEGIPHKKGDSVKFQR
jgi:hypothetical protein